QKYTASLPHTLNQLVELFPYVFDISAKGAREPTDFMRFCPVQFSRSRRIERREVGRPKSAAQEATLLPYGCLVKHPHGFRQQLLGAA
ncbi:MAG TPA: hypothetical protein VNJ51_12680, partial [Candidatus Dormibacteraeota bacterium]|nr:hypothetical protein [Candidatus Dormibacteraeota bacterium]